MLIYIVDNYDEGNRSVNELVAVFTDELDAANFAPGGFVTELYDAKAVAKMITRSTSLSDALGIFPEKSSSTA